MSESQLNEAAPTLRLEVAAAQEGFRADRALAALRPDLSRRTAKLLFHGGHVRLNGRRADGSERVRAGDRLTFPDTGGNAGGAWLRRAAGPRLVTRHGRQVARLYEDDHLLVISKPAEILIHPAPDSPSRRETLADVFARAYPQAATPSQAPRGGEEWESESVGERSAAGAEENAPLSHPHTLPRSRSLTPLPSAACAPAAGAPAAPEGIYFVHRLDMETTGCLLVAKAAGPRDALIRAFQERRVEKEYLAVVVGEVPWEKKVSKRPIIYRRGGEARPLRQRCTARGMPDWARIKKHGLLPRFVKKGVALAEGDARGKPCETTFNVEERFRGYTVVRCAPRTGRLHQVRVHLAAEGFPLAYDPLYGRRSALRLDEFCASAARRAAGDEIVLNRLPLHARRLAFQHPVTGERVEVEAPLPGDLKEFLRVLRKFRRIAARGRV